MADTAAEQVKSDNTEDVKYVKEETPFTVQEKCDDEVVLLFDDGQKLFVSRNFLCLASPVFLKMFASDFKEKQTGTVELKGKTYDDVLEFLLILHPCENKHVTEANMYQVLSLAEEYQVKKCIQNCRNQLSISAKKAFNIIINEKEQENIRIKGVGSCLKMLSTASLYGYTDIEDQLTTILAKVGSNVYTVNYCGANYSIQIISAFSDSTFSDRSLKIISQERQKLIDSFSSLPAVTKVALLQKRLAHTDNKTVLDS